MKAQRIGLVVACLLPALAAAQDRVELNAISRIVVRAEGVEIVGSRKANFTTFTLQNPPRLGIDLSEAVFQGVPELLQGKGGITGVKTASYGASSTAIARVLIGFDHDVETDIVASGNSLVVKVLAGASEPPF